MKYIQFLFITLGAVILSNAAQSHVTFDIEYMDIANYGFNDTSRVAAVGQNNAPTLGAQRKKALEYSLKLFEYMLDSDIPIHIEASFQNLGGSTQRAILASAGPEWFNFNFPNTPQNDIAYPSALANKLSGFDLSDASSGISDIKLIINANIDGSALGASQFYYGLDNKPPPLAIDFVSVITHEIIHGLGFISAIDTLTGHKFGCHTEACRTNMYADIYSTFLARIVDNQTMHLIDMNQSDRLAALSAENQIVWTGTNAKNAASSLQSGTLNAMPKIYSPNPVENGSSLTHTDFSLEPRELMQPAYSGYLLTTPVNIAMLSDIGWGDEGDLALSARMTESTELTASIIITIINNGSSNVSPLNISLSSDQATLSLQDQDSNLSCGTIGNKTLACELTQLATQQIYQTTIFVNRSPEKEQAVNFTASISADILDIAPDNNQETIKVFKSTSRTVSLPQKTAAPSQLQNTKGGSFDSYFLYFFGFYWVNLWLVRRFKQ